MEEFTNSIKAKLYDSFSTSFMASFIISSILINHKYILIYFSSAKDMDTKLKYLDHYYLGFEVFIFFPLIIALFYTLIFPIMNHGLLWITERHKNKSKSIKIKAHDKKPMDEEDKKHFISEIVKLKKELNEKNEFVSKMEKLADAKVVNKENKIQELEKTINSYNTEISELNKSLTNYTLKIEEDSNQKRILDNQIERQKKQINDLEKKVELTKDCSNKLDELTNHKKEADKFWGNRNQELSDENDDLQSELIELKKIESEYKKISKDSDTLFYDLTEQKNINTKLENDNQNLCNIISTNGIDVNFNNNENFSPNEVRVLRALGEKNYKSKSNDYDSFIDSITSWLKISRFLVEDIISSLLEKNYILKDQYQKISISKIGRKIILKILADKEMKYL